MSVVWITIIALVAVCQASPLPHKLKYDQKQEGQLNIRADLENFIILVIPTSSHGSSAAANGSLLDFLSKTIPLPYYKKPKKHLKVHHHEDDILPDTEQFIESKTAPYHVDISRTRSHLAKLHPEVAIPENVKDEIIIARSPSVALSKSQDIPLLQPEGRDRQQLKSARAILITVPMGNENIQRHGIKDVVGGKGGEDIKKSVGLSIEAIEKGLQLADEMQTSMKESKNKIEIVEVVKEKPENSNGNYLAKLDEIAEEIKKNETVNKAVVMAKVIQAGLSEFFRKLAERYKKQADNERLIENDEPASKLSDVLRQKAHKVLVTIKEKTGDKENSKVHRGLNKKFEDIVEKLKENREKENIVIPSMPKGELEPPKMPEKERENNNVSKDPTEKPSEEPNNLNKESPKDELLLLGAEHEQCGPEQERDSSGICTSSIKS